ncbi:MAG TPA: DUF4214 domain-containing protein [Iamia sp.]|nr:DUF4214 domain-containing protein [Iamia sp.]
MVRRRILRAALVGVVATTALLVGSAGPSAAACTPPIHDDLVGNFPLINPSGAINGDISCTTPEAGEPHHAGYSPTSSLWYRWRNQSNHATQLQLWTVGSTADTRLAAYLSTTPPSYSSIVLLASNDDVGPSSRWSQIVVNVPANTTAYIAVDRGGLPIVGQASITLRWRFSYAPFEAPVAFINAFFEDFHGRPATTQEKNNYDYRLTREPAEDVARAILDFAGGASANDPVARLYRAYFARRTDGAGLRYWADQLRVGKSINAVSDFFSKSHEFKTKYGPLGNTAFVNLVYTNVLGRPASTADRSYWVGQLGLGYSRSKLMLQFAQSSENRTDSDRRLRTDIISSLTGVAIADPGRKALPDGSLATEEMVNHVLRTRQYTG